jgi:hypothetical protein
MRLVKLGKKPPRFDKRTMRLENYIAQLPPVPPVCDWLQKVSSWPVMLNAGDGAIGDCTIAAAGHLIQEWTANAGNMIIPADADILAAYEAVSSYDPATGDNDNGAAELDVLNYWRQNGIAGHKIGAFAALQFHNLMHVKAAIYLLEGCYIGLALPQSAQHEDIWTNINDKPGSWGLHAVPVGKYDQQGLTAITWGGIQKMTWAFWQKYCDEAYALISLDMLNNQQKSPIGLNLQQLQKDLSIVTG